MNGIRAREAQFQEWVASAQPDVSACRNQSLHPQIPESICNLGGYWCYWHGAAAYSGVALHLRRETFPREPKFTHPEFDHDAHRDPRRHLPSSHPSIRTAARLRGEDRVRASLIAYARMHREQGPRHLRRLQRRAHGQGVREERKPGIIGQRRERDLSKR